jgi:ankyrin repeat protein
MAAAARGHDGVVRLLLRAGADPEAKAPCGTALDLARANGHPGTAAILAEALGR